MRSPAPAPEHEPELHGTPWYWSACFASRGRVVHHFARLHHLSSCASRCTLRRLRNSPRATEIRWSQQSFFSLHVWHEGFFASLFGVYTPRAKKASKLHQPSINSFCVPSSPSPNDLPALTARNFMLCFASVASVYETSLRCHRDRDGVREFIFSCTSSRRWLALKSTYGEPLAAPHRYSQVLSFAYCTQQSHALHCHRRGAHRLAATFAFTFL